MEEIEKAREIVNSSKRVLFLTGAGISAESGVPTFRGGGTSTVWRGMPFEELSSARMVERDLPLVWEWFDYRRGIVAGCAPNAGHLSIAVIQHDRRFRGVTLVTQNIDGLHARAGSSGGVELHGNIDRARCLSCGRIENIWDLPVEERPPVCTECGDSMRPDVVLFGEYLPEGAIPTALAKAEACDLCIVVGTSALVHPANGIPTVAKRAGAKVIEVNPEETALTRDCDVSLRGGAAEVLPKLLFSAPKRMRLGRRILSLGCEGGEVDIYRYVLADGEVAFNSLSAGGGLLDEDEDPYVESERGPHGTLRDAIEATGVGNHIFFFTLTHMHPGVVDDLRDYLKEKLESLSADDRLRLGRSAPDSVDSWMERDSRF